MMWVSKKHYADLIARVGKLESRARALEYETGLRAEVGGSYPFTTSSELAALRRDFAALVKSLGLQRKQIPAEKAKVEYVAPPAPVTSSSFKMKKGE